MDVRQSPFPLGWYTSATLEEFWGGEGTYMRIPYDALPSIEGQRFDGTFAWLPPLRGADLALDFDESRPENLARLARLFQETDRLGLTVPESFVSFVSRPELHCRVPICTECYLEIPERVIESMPGTNGYLLRFMNDQQLMLLWYLYLRPDGDHGIVVGNPQWRDEPQGSTIEGMYEVKEQLLCAPDFESFIYRFWLENSVWYALSEGRALTPPLQAYLDAAKRALASR